MNRKEAEDFVYSSYLRAEKYHGYEEKDAERRHPEFTRELLRKKSGTPAAIVTGSKGKGSVSKMIAEILQTKFTVGLMTSPHIEDFCERFQVNGEKVSSPLFSMLMEEIRPEIEEIDRKIPKEFSVSPMGIQADFALTWFRSRKTDFNVFECGKGAKLDDVNNILHDYAVMNSVFLEHRRELGNTIAEIAEDKAHVITGREKAVFVGEQTKEAMAVIEKRAALFSVPLKVYGRDFWEENLRTEHTGIVFDLYVFGKRYRDIRLPLLGDFQAKNCALAMAVSETVFSDLSGKASVVEESLPNPENLPSAESAHSASVKGPKSSCSVMRSKSPEMGKTFEMDAVRKRLSEINWPGRLELISGEPFILLDCCINRVSTKAVKAVLAERKIEKPVSIIAIPEDKDYRGVVQEMSPLSESVILTRTNNPHYHFSEKQCERMAEEGIATEWAENFTEAMKKAEEKGLPIVILGTTSLLPEVKNWQKRIKNS
ncbi:bifunctional folylpolyglutamate synthase/dihydrofolate synthase [Oribacterium asaccharolyticum]|uniref:bifunctional folylpolyglutamate synthase/dihydrofolate synthase n=1 Tax=Oribacterium asaccharolyticum TaxID=1501332 RepID=UPI0028F0428F|nr:Mur ligase family protein [Oribacterium asaccharolyticum]